MSTIVLLQAAVQSVPSPVSVLARAWAWLYLHWVVALAVVVWVVANVAPRPHPEQLTGWKRIFWRVVDALCVLTAAKLPGGFKLPGVASPPLVVPADDRVVVPVDVQMKDSEDTKP
jgi:hypothetical protein